MRGPETSLWSELSALDYRTIKALPSHPRAFRLDSTGQEFARRGRIPCLSAGAGSEQPPDRLLPRHRVGLDVDTVRSLAQPQIAWGYRQPCWKSWAVARKVAGCSLSSSSGVLRYSRTVSPQSKWAGALCPWRVRPAAALDAVVQSVSSVKATEESRCCC